MFIAINTGSLNQDTPKALERAAALGFRHVEINLQSDEFDYGYRRRPNVRFYRQMKNQLDDLNLSVWSVSPPRLTQEQMFSARARQDILKGSAGAAGILGGKVFVVQPADLFDNEQAFNTYLEYRKAPPIIKGYDEAWVQVVNRRMTMALTNRDYWIGAPLTNQAKEMEKILDDLAVGCAFDLPRALHRNTLPVWLGSVGERLAVAYLYDLLDDDTPVAPSANEWQESLSLINSTRLKCLVIRSGISQSDDEIVQSYEEIKRALEGAG